MNAGYLDINNIVELGKDYAVCVGTFDGVHMGHQELINRAKSLGLKLAVLLIFSIDNVMKKHAKDGLLMSIADRTEVFTNLGASALIYIDLDERTRSLSPQQFVDKVLKPLNVSAVIVGDDFRFGAEAKGNVEMLKELAGDDFKVEVVEPVLYSKKRRVSTTRIKQLIAQGRIEEANVLITRPYKITGIITRGFGLGSKIGYATANILLDYHYFIPKMGIYLVEVTLRDQKHYGMCNIGIHPTINKLTKSIIEVHLFDFSEQIYDEVINISFLKYLRNEVKFPDLESLIHQIDQDKEDCLKLIKEIENN
ncbi:MAG TPA: riboflavin biosynthesis protein RibF [Bacilli bacterium]|nr:riboflavin biosynthesis protein RibF [Bacilli bacterium]